MNRDLIRVIALFVVGAMMLGGGGAISLATAQEGPPGTGDNPFAELGLPEITLTLTESAIEGAPNELSAGRYVVAVTNTIPAPDPSLGPPVSGVVFVQVPADTAVADFVAQLSPPAPADDGGDTASPPAGPMAPPAWYYETVLSGGPYVLPGQTGYAVIDLAAGEWAVWAQSVAPPAAVALTVTDEDTTEQPVPPAVVRVEMAEYSFSVSPGLAAGPQLIEVVNIGEQPHFLSMTGVPAGTTVDEVMTLLGMGSDPAATPDSGLGFVDLVPVLDSTPQSSGATAWYAADVAPGTYFLACYVPDPGSGAPHAMLGMAQIVEVE